MDDDKRDDLNQKIINIGGTALLGTSFVTAGTVAIGRAAVAKRAAKGEFGKDVNPKMMNEGSELAMKAFTRATIYTCGTFGSIIGTWCWYNNVWSIKDLRKHLKRFGPLLKWGASARWLSSLFYHMRNLDEMSIWKTHPTLGYVEL